MKRFQELRESVYSPNGVNVPDASDGMDAVGLYAIEQPEGNSGLVPFRLGQFRLQSRHHLHDFPGLL